MIYKIKDEYLEVINYCNEYDEYIFKRFSQFEIVTNKEINNYLRFNETSVEININGDYKILKNRIVKTDIYPIINNVIAYIINDKSNMFVHSLVVSKGNNGILIIGEFGQGKSTFAKEFVNNGYEINSTDQTWLKFKENDLYQELGSSFDKDYNALFLSSRGKRISKRSVQNIIKSELVELVEAEGKESKKYHTHTLRHTGATLLYNEANANIFVLKIILGHESLDATQVYTHVSDKKLKELMQNFNILDRKE